MTSEAKKAANRLNSLKSTGPTSVAGKARASLNARKHGLHSERTKMFREDSFAFEERLGKWGSIGDAENDLEEFLVHENVAMAFEIQHTRRALNERGEARLNMPIRTSTRP